jgi:unsaturated pyranuronate lyase
MNRRVGLHRWDDLPLDKVTEMVARKAIVGEGETLVQTYLKKGAIVPQHAHRTGQLIYVLQGALRVLVDDEEITVHEGDVLGVPAGAAHQVEAIDDTFVLDVRGTEGDGT